MKESGIMEAQEEGHKAKTQRWRGEERAKCWRGEEGPRQAVKGFFNLTHYRWSLKGFMQKSEVMIAP